MRHEFAEFPAELPELELHPDVTLGGLAYDSATGVAGRVVAVDCWEGVGWVVRMLTDITGGTRRSFPADAVRPGLPPEPEPEPPLLSVRLPWDVLRSMMRADLINSNATEAERILLDALPKDVHDRLAAELDQ